MDPTFSPDGKMMAFVSGRFAHPHIFVPQLQWNGDTDVKELGDKAINLCRVV